LPRPALDAAAISPHKETSMPTPPSLRYTPPEHAADLDPAALAERYPFLPAAGLWDVPDWLARATIGFAADPVAARSADWQAPPTVAPPVHLLPR
jgi:hypothetical protein